MTQGSQIKVKVPSYIILSLGCLLMHHRCYPQVVYQPSRNTPLEKIFRDSQMRACAAFLANYDVCYSLPVVTALHLAGLDFCLHSGSQHRRHSFSQQSNTVRLCWQSTNTT